jgi:hypothetical protein
MAMNMVPNNNVSNSKRIRYDVSDTQLDHAQFFYYFIYNI